MSRGEDEAFAVAIQAEGRFVAAGASERRCLCFAFDFALARYTSAGSLDKSFGAGGKVRTQIVPGCVVPRLVGLMLPRAKRSLAAAHCRAGKVLRRHAAAPRGRVLDQSLARGWHLVGGATVRLLVSLGPARGSR